MDDETLTDAKIEIERLRTERRELDQQIAYLESNSAVAAVDPSVEVETIQVPSGLINLI